MCCGTRRDLYADLAVGGERLLLVGDLDGFRRYNSLHGYEAGDALLHAVGERLASAGRAYHVGGDSFAVFLDGTPLELARSLSAAIDALTVDGPEPLRSSIGAAFVGREADGSRGLALAEERLEDQKRRGLVFADRVAKLLFALIDAHDPALAAHSSEVARLADAVAFRLGLSIADRALVRRAAELHDVGKLAIDPAILGRSGRLEDAEWAEIQRHTVVGDELLRSLPSLADVAPIVRASHECFDGRGYPDRQSGVDIPIAARIVAACDAYHAMVSERPYAATRTSEDASAELEACAGSQFDPAVVGAVVAELADRRVWAGGSDEQASESSSLHGLARLHALLDSATLVEHPDELPRALETIARVVGETLDYGAVAINLYRHEWDDFVVSTVHGEDPVLAELLGSTYDWEMWESLLDQRFLRAGAYTVYAGEYEWEAQSGARIVPDLAAGADPDAWQAEDEIFVPFRHSDGHILGIFNVSLPGSGRRPSDEQLHLLATVVRHAARAVQRAQEASAAVAHRRALEQLLRISSKLTETASGTSVLEAISVGISEALEFRRVGVHLHDRETGALTPAAAAGFDVDDPALVPPFGLAELQRIFEPRYEVEGCYLVPLEEAAPKLPSLDGFHQSALNGRGPWAWRRHWLVVPLLDWNGECLGVVFADDPVDRLLPSKERLQALRLFANQATVALESVAQYEAQRYLAEHDSLTNLRNRHSFMRELEAAVVHAWGAGEELTVVYCDLDAFKELNDVFGHTTGDRALECFSTVLAESVRHGDTAFRLGGDEFALLLRDCGRDGARGIVERALDRWAAAAELDVPLRSVGASFGVAVLDAKASPSVEELLRRADEAMYQAKRGRTVLEIAA